MNSLAYIYIYIFHARLPPLLYRIKKILQRNHLTIEVRMICLSVISELKGRFFTSWYDGNPSDAPK